MAYGDGGDDLYDDGWDPYDEEDEPDDDPRDEGPDDGGWGADPPARQGGLRLLVGLAALLVAIGLIAALSKASDDDDADTDEVATDERSTTSRQSSTSRPLGLPGDPRPTVTTRGGSSSTSSTTRGSSTTRRPATTVTTDPDAPEPACVSAGGGAATPVQADWAERWQTMPKPNDPATLSLCVDDITPQVGQTVTVSIVGDDPDAIFPTSECGVFVTWEGSHASFCRDFLIAWEDPRPTPKEEPGHVLQHLSHVYDTPGSKTLTGSVWSAEYDGYTSPYSSRAQAALTINVHS
jgi:hypothetical protein